MGNTAAVIKVRYADCFEASLHVFHTDASTLGLPPGRWPNCIETDDMGNKQPFTLLGLDRSSSDRTLGARYRQSLGCLTLIVAND